MRQGLSIIKRGRETYTLYQNWSASSVSEDQGTSLSDSPPTYWDGVGVFWLKYRTLVLYLSTGTGVLAYMHFWHTRVLFLGSDRERIELSVLLL